MLDRVRAGTASDAVPAGFRRQERLPRGSAGVRGLKWAHPAKARQPYATRRAARGLKLPQVAEGPGCRLTVEREHPGDAARCILHESYMRLQNRRAPGWLKSAHFQRSSTNLSYAAVRRQSPLKSAAEYRAKGNKNRTKSEPIRLSVTRAPGPRGFWALRGQAPEAPHANRLGHVDRHRVPFPVAASAARVASQPGRP